MGNNVTEDENKLPAGTRVPLLKILLAFLKIGAFTFGGGYAILPIIRQEIIHHLKWMDAEGFMDILLVTQSLPGSVALSCSIIVGQRLRGTIGGLVAALGIVIPSFLTILFLVAFLLPMVQENVFVQAVFYGLRPAVAALVASAVWELGKEFAGDRLSIIILITLLPVSLMLHLHPVLVLALGALLGLFCFQK